MAMSKKEKAEFEQARSFRSLRFSDYPTTRDVKPEDTLVAGFDINPSRVITISTIGSYKLGVSHRHSSQGGVSLYSTRKRALGALRRELEDEFARILMEIDDAIAEEDEAEIDKQP